MIRPARDKFIVRIYCTLNLSIYCDKFHAINSINSIKIVIIKCSRILYGNHPKESLQLLTFKLFGITVADFGSNPATL